MTWISHDHQLSTLIDWMHLIYWCSTDVYMGWFYALVLVILNMANFCRICFYYSRISWQCMTMILQKVLWHIIFWGRFPRLPKLTSMRHTKKIPGDFYANCSKYRCNLFHKAQPTTINFKPGLQVTYWSTQLETNASNIDFGRQSTYHFSLPEAPNQIWP